MAKKPEQWSQSRFDREQANLGVAPLEHPTKLAVKTPYPPPPTEGASRGGMSGGSKRGYTPEGKPKERVGVRSFQTKSGLYPPRIEIVWDGKRLGDSKGYRSVEEAKEAARKLVAQDPNYREMDDD